MKKLLLIGAVCLLLLSTGSAIAESTAVMVYLCGSNLESLYGSATKDIQEMLHSGLDAKETQVFIMTGGSRAWADASISPNNTCIYTLVPKAHGGGLKMKLVDSTPSRNMGEAETLSYFLNFCAEYGEADRRALILWDHGGGPVNGVCWDENFGTDHLSLEEITAALSQSPFSQDKLEWIGFDACLMSSVEVASKLSPYAKYMISSQAEEPASGWDYSFLKGLENDAGGGATGQRIVEAYFAVEQKYAADRTLSCVDLSAVAEIESSMNAMYAGMAARLNRDTFSALSKLRFKATGYGKSAAAKASNGYDLVDIASLTESYAALDPEGAEAVKEAVQRAVLCNQSNVPGSSGLSVYHPYRNQNRFTSEWRDNYAQLGFCPGYTAYVNAYGQIMTGGSLTRWSGLNDIQAAADGSLVTLNLTQEQAENLSSARLIVLARNVYDAADDAYFRVFSTAEVSQSGLLLSAAYDGSTLRAVNAAGYSTLTASLSYRLTEGGVYQVDLYPIDENLNRAQAPIVAEYTLNAAGQLELKDYLTLDEVTGMYSSRVEVDWSRYGGVTFLNEYRNPTANAEGEFAGFDDWNEDAHRDTQWRARADVDRTDFLLTFSTEAVAGEELYAAYELIDTQGNVYTSALTPLDGGAASYAAGGLRLGGALPAASASLVLSPEEGAARLVLSLQNVSGTEQAYSLGGILVNDREIPSPAVTQQGGSGQPFRGRGQPCALPGETVTQTVRLPAESLDAVAEDGLLRRLSGRLRVFSPDGEKQIASVPFAVEPMASLSLLRGGAELHPPLLLPDSAACPWKVSAVVFVRRGGDAVNARLIANVLITNTGNEDLHALVNDVTLNGQSIIDAAAVHALGTGAADKYGRQGIAPGETRAVSVSLRQSDLSPLFPDVALSSLGFTLIASRAAGEKTEIVAMVPYASAVDIPLSPFYGETDTLPSQAVVSLGEEYGLMDRRARKPLFSYQNCVLSLQALFVRAGQPILLLRCDNRSAADWRVFLGQAAVNDAPASLGQSQAPSVAVRNRRVRFFGLNKPMWQAPAGVSLTVPTGDTAYCYASLSTGGETALRSLSFSAYLYPEGDSLNGAYIGPIRLTAEDAVRLDGEEELMAPAAYFRIEQGAPRPKEEQSPFRENVQAEAPEAYPRYELSFIPENGADIGQCYYALLRRVRSNAELADMNIEGTLPFADGREWMLYLAYGSMAVSPDGKSAAALFPGMLPAVRSGGESLPLNVAYIEEDSHAVTLKKQGRNDLFPLSAVFPGAALGDAVYAVGLCYDEAAGNASLLAFDHVQSAFPSLAGVAYQRVLAVPADGEEDTLFEALSTAEAVENCAALAQSLLLDGPAMQLALEPVIEPENYAVAFFYRAMDGAYHCAPPRLLSDFAAQ